MTFFKINYEVDTGAGFGTAQPLAGHDPSGSSMELISVFHGQTLVDFDEDDVVRFEVEWGTNQANFRIQYLEFERLGEQSGV